MKLIAPFGISSRLLPSFRIDGASVSLEFDGYSADNREVWRWFVDLPNGQEFSLADLKSGVGQVASTQQMFETLLSCMLAAAESYPDGENCDLFPPAVVEWVHQKKSELKDIQQQIEYATESEHNLIED